MKRLPDPMRWLAAGIPVTLLVDLLDESGPRSREILVGEPADTEWVVRARRITAA